MLTPRQEKFCIEYMKCGNGRQAYINAGYKRNKDSTVDVNACNLLKNPKVKARLQELTEEAKNNAIADIREMQEVLTSIIRRELTEEVVVVEGDRARTVKKNVSVKDIVSAIDKLGKMQGAFKDRIELEAIVPVFIGEDELE